MRPALAKPRACIQAWAVRPCSRARDGVTLMSHTQPPPWRDHRQVLIAPRALLRQRAGGEGDVDDLLPRVGGGAPAAKAAVPAVVRLGAAFAGGSLELTAGEVGEARVAEGQKDGRHSPTSPREERALTRLAARRTSLARPLTTAQRGLTGERRLRPRPASRGEPDGIAARISKQPRVPPSEVEAEFAPMDLAVTRRGRYSSWSGLPILTRHTRHLCRLRRSSRLSSSTRGRRST